MDDILQCAYKKACTGVTSVVHTVFEQILFDQLSQEVMGNTLGKHIAK